MKSFLRAIGVASDKLVTSGIFKISRNPQSLARGFGILSIGIMGRSFYTLNLGIIWIFLNHITILIEEKHLKTIFGELYLQYLSVTPRYLKVIKKNKTNIRKAYNGNNQ